MTSNMSNKLYYEFFRGTSIGKALLDTLDEMVLANRIEPQTAYKILADFDKAMADNLATKVMARLNFKGHLDTYRNCDEVWMFHLTNVNFTLDNQSQFQADKIKIVSCNSKGPGGQ